MPHSCCSFYWLSLAGALVARSAASAAGGLEDASSLLQARLDPGGGGVLTGPSSSERLEALLRAVDGAEGQAPLPERQGSRQSMINFGDAQYISYITMGKQRLAGILDTGSYELVVFGSDCATCGPAAHYNARLSSSFSAGVLQRQQNYGSGGTTCSQGFENVSVGPYGVSEKQMFWNVQQATMPVLSNAAFEAIIGVGPPEEPMAEVWQDAQSCVKNVTGYYDRAVAAPPGVVAAAQEMIDIALSLNKALPILHNYNVRSFSVCLGARAGDDGTFIWDDTLAEEQPDLFARVPVVGNHTWSANMTVPKLAISKGEDVTLGCEEGCTAILDTGTSLIAVPSAVLHHVKLAMEKLDTNCSNLEVLPDLTFNLGNQPFTLPPSAYVAEVLGDVPQYLQDRMPHLVQTHRSCTLMLMDTVGMGAEANLWILGVPFFRSYYVNFDLVHGMGSGERAFYIAPHAQDSCEPSTKESRKVLEMRETRRVVNPLRRVQADRLHVPWRSAGGVPPRDRRIWLSKEGAGI